MMKIFGKFHRNQSIKALSKANLVTQSGCQLPDSRTDGRTTRKHNASAAYWWWKYKNTKKVTAADYLTK